MDKVFVVMNVNSVFIGVYTSKEKAQEVVARMNGVFLDEELIIVENILNDFSMFDPLISDEQLLAYVRIN